MTDAAEEVANAAQVAQVTKVGDHGAPAAAAGSPGTAPVERAAAGSRAAIGAKAQESVVFLALLLVGEHLIGFADLLEAGLVATGVGMMLARQLLEGLLYLID